MCCVCLVYVLLSLSVIDYYSVCDKSRIGVRIFWVNNNIKKKKAGSPTTAGTPVYYLLVILILKKC
jgi:hypothetical protein